MIFEIEMALVAVVTVVVGWLCRSAGISLCLSALQADSEQLRWLQIVLEELVSLEVHYHCWTY